MFRLFTDGGARGNPGPAAIGIFLFQDSELVDFSGSFIGLQTNNFAEYKALVEGLNLAIKNNVEEIDCYLDSELVVKQLLGEYKVKNKIIKVFYDKVIELKKSFKSINFHHIPREKNKNADRMLNLILDSIEIMINREDSIDLLNEYIKNDALKNHCKMVARAMEAYAKHLGKSQDEIDKWWTAGLLHDLDWEKYPDEHPKKAIEEILPGKKYDQDIINAIAAHAQERTGKYPETDIERYLFACDEISGFMNAASLVRPDGFNGMKVKSITKKLKDSHFAAAVSREDIKKGASLIDKELNDHIQFLINVFTE